MLMPQAGTTGRARKLARLDGGVVTVFLGSGPRTPSPAANGLERGMVGIDLTAGRSSFQETVEQPGSGWSRFRSSARSGPWILATKKATPEGVALTAMIKPEGQASGHVLPPSPGVAQGTESTSHEGERQRAGFGDGRATQRLVVDRLDFRSA